MRLPRATEFEARGAAGLWRADAFSLEHLGDSGSSVYAVQDPHCAPTVLRLTREPYRSTDDTRAEVDFLAYLVAAGCAVNAPVRTLSGTYVERVKCGDGWYVASMVEWVPGRVARVEDGELGAAEVTAWAVALASIHAAARGFRPGSEHPRRWQWCDEIVFRLAGELIPARCDALRGGLEAAIDAVAALPVSEVAYGMVHGDHGPQNLHFGAGGRVATFDFGNCCYQFFVSDVAIALGVLRRYAPRTVDARTADFWLPIAACEARCPVAGARRCFHATAAVLRVSRTAAPLRRGAIGAGALLPLRPSNTVVFARSIASWMPRTTSVSPNRTDVRRNSITLHTYHPGMSAAGPRSPCYAPRGNRVLRPEEAHERVNDIRGIAMTKRFDAVVIGAGQSGPFLAAKLTSRGQSVALIERRQLGGTCINDGCTPTKTLRKSARVAYLARRAAEFGVRLGSVEIDFEVAMARMRTRVEQSRTGLETWLGGIDDLTIINSVGRLVRRTEQGFEIEAGGQTLLTGRVFLNTGTRPFVPSIEGLDETPFLTNEDVLELTACPTHLLILGGSYIGLEMGQIFRRLGAQVTVIEVGPRITSREDVDISEALTEHLSAEGLAIQTGCNVTRAGGETGAVWVELEDGARIHGSHLLVATGRVPNTDELGLGSIGLEPDRRGYIETNGKLETKIPGLYALGDINRRGAFTHTSYHDHEIVAENLNGGNRSADDRFMAYAMFTDPPLGHVGLYERDARELVSQGRSISQAVFAMKNVSRAKEESEETGLVKLLIDEETNRFVGASILGINADEIIQAISLVMATGGTWQQVRDALPVHPTVTEFLPTILDRRAPLEPG